MTDTATDPLVGQQIGTESSLSSWAGPYVTDILGKGKAVSEMPYQAYMGPLSAGASDLQNKAFSGIASMPLPSMNNTYTPMSFTDSGIASKYMNPYLQQVLDPQLKEARRQADITRVNQAGRLTQAGAYGGSRQAIMESALNRDLMNKQNDITGQGYFNAYETGRGQFNTEEDRRKSGIMDQNRFGLDYLDRVGKFGETQRGIEQEGITADYNQFKEERDHPYKNVQYLQSLLQGLPLATQNYSYAEPSSINKFLGGAGGIMELLNGWGDLFGDD